MYLRTKSIRNRKTGAVYRYAYAVENRWRRKKGGGKQARQKVKHYLGKVHSFPPAQEIAFFSFMGIEEAKKEEYLRAATAKRLVKALVEWELAAHKAEGFSVDFSSGAVLKDGKPASIAMNEGMLNTFTLRRLLVFKAGNGDEETGYGLAKAFVEAGIRVPEDVFVSVFGKAVGTAPDTMLP